MRRIWHGFCFPFRGLRFLFGRPDLLPFVALPALINIGLLGTAGIAAWHGAEPLTGLLWSEPHAAAEGHAMWVVATWLVMFALMGLGTLATYLIAGIVGTPFYDRLSQAVEDKLLGARAEPFSWTVFAGDVSQSLRHSVAALGLWAGGMVALLALNLIPVVGSVLEFVLGIAWTALMLTREMMDGAMSRRRLAFRRKLQIVRDNYQLALGFGTATALLMWVPLLNFLAMPVAVVGGTLMFLEIEGGAEPQPTPT